MLIDILSFSCPLILCSFGALFSEYAGCLALFLEGLVSFSAFLNFAFSVWTGNLFLGGLLSVFSSVIMIFAFAWLIERFGAHKFIAGTAINLLLVSLTSCFAFIFFGSRGVLSSPSYHYDLLATKIFTIVFSAIMVGAAILFLMKSRQGLYLRITGSDSDVLLAKGVNPSFSRVLSWGLAALYASLAGLFLTMRISSFVPNISSGRGWMALAAIFLGKKKPLRMVFAVIIFCATDYFGIHIQNIFPSIPTSVLLSLPYTVALLLTVLK